MFNTNDIYRFLDNQMTDEEKKNFEQQILNSDELKNEFEKLKSNFELIKVYDNIEVDESYFTNGYIRFREKQEISKKKKIKLGFAYGFASFVIIGFIFFFTFIFKTSNQNVISNNFSGISKGEISHLINSYSSLSDSYELIENEIDFNIVEEKISEELIISKETIIKYDSQIYDIKSMLNDVSDDQIEIIYKELSTKKIL